MPESVSGVDEPCGCCGGSEACELPARIKAAVHAAVDARTQEIVEEIRDGITMIADNEFEEGANAALESALGLIARRFPNGGTHDA